MTCSTPTESITPPKGRALADAAVNEALRLRPDLPEAHLALATHLYFYRDFERARVQIAIAARALSNSSALLELAALIDQVQGRWENSVAGLERAATLDPRNPELLATLAGTYSNLRRFQDAQRILDRVIQLQPDDVASLEAKVGYAFSENADVNAARAAFESLPASIKDDPIVRSARVYYAVCARDFDAAEEILRRGQNKEAWICRALVPKEVYTLWLEFLRGNHPTIEQFGAVRDELNRKVEGDPTNPFLLTVLAWADLALGRQEQVIEEGRRAMELRPISEDAVYGPAVATWVAEVYSLANQADLAFEQLHTLVKIPGVELSYGDLKIYPSWDPLRKDPRFEKLLAELAPRN